MSKISIEIEQLTVSERLDLIGEIWDSIPDAEYEDHLTPQQQAELDETIAEVERCPEQCVTWEEVMKEVRAQKQ